MDKLCSYFDCRLSLRKEPTVFILYGPTATAKTAISVELSILYNAEIVNCDMAQIFSEGKIATGHITEEDKKGVPHHLFGFLELPSYFSVYKMRLLIEKKIKDIFSRGKNVIIVGGSGFCILSLFFIPSRIYFSYSKEILDTSPRLSEIIARGIFQTSQDINSDYIVYFPFFSYELIYIDLQDRAKWISLLKARIDGFLQKGLLKEIASMPEEWRQFLFRKKIIGYHQLLSYFYECNGSELFFSDNDSLSKKKELIFFATCQYGKRQRTFMRKMQRDLLLYEVSSFLHTVSLKDIHY